MPYKIIIITSASIHSERPVKGGTDEYPDRGGQLPHWKSSKWTNTLQNDDTKGNHQNMVQCQLFQGEMIHT